MVHPYLSMRLCLDMLRVYVIPSKSKHTWSRNVYIDSAKVLGPFLVDYSINIVLYTTWKQYSYLSYKQKYLQLSIVIVNGPLFKTYSGEMLLITLYLLSWSFCTVVVSWVVLCRENWCIWFIINCVLWLGFCSNKHAIIDIIGLAKK